MYNNSPQSILLKLELVRNAFSENKIDMPVEAAAEYMFDADFEAYVNEGLPLLTFGKNLILIENVLCSRIK